jgi:SAM-dependent methyltransferase
MSNLLLDALLGYRVLAAIAAACHLSVFTRLSAHPQTVVELAERSGADSARLRILLDACVALGLLEQEGEQYGNSCLAELHLVEGRPLYLGHLIYVFTQEAPEWEDLHERLLPGGGTARLGSVGDVEPNRFTLAMHALGALGEAQNLADSVDLDGRGDLVDVGCGSGIYSITLCRRYPALRATLIDRANVLETTRRVVAESGVADRLTLVAGDIMAGDYGRDRDVVLFSDVLYGTQASRTAMLRSAFTSLKPGGLLVLRGYYADPEGGRPVFGAMFELARMVWDPANEPITLQSLRRWVAEAGFCAVETFPVTDRSSGLIARKS